MINTSYQGIGISSSPEIKKDPISLDLLRWMEYGSRFSETHQLWLVDTPQILNYQAIHGISERSARSIIKNKGHAKAKDLELIIGAHKLKNVKVIRHEQIFEKEQKEMLDLLLEIYNSDPEIKEAVDNCVPSRLTQKAKHPELLKMYALTEIALILTHSGIKLGHNLEITYDNAAVLIHDKYDLGISPEFHYPALGLEVIPSNGLKLEPYSAAHADKRLLLTDDLNGLRKKYYSLNSQRQKGLRRNLSDLVDESEGEFVIDQVHEKYIRPVKSARSWMRAKIAMLAASFLLLFTGGAGYSEYRSIQNDVQAISYEEVSKIPAYIITGATGKRFTVAFNEAGQRTDERLEQKYGWMGAFAYHPWLGARYNFHDVIKEDIEYKQLLADLKAQYGEPNSQNPQGYLPSVLAKQEQPTLL